MKNVFPLNLPSELPPDGSISALTLTGQPMSPNHNALAWIGGPVASFCHVLADWYDYTKFDNFF